MGHNFVRRHVSRRRRKTSKEWGTCADDEAIVLVSWRPLRSGQDRFSVGFRLRAPTTKLGVGTHRGNASSQPQFH